MLVVEDDPRLAMRLADLLRGAAVETSVVTRGDVALAEVDRFDTDLVMISRDPADMDAVELCLALRGAGYDAGLIVVSTRESEIEIVAALDAGADDYLVSPYSVAELQSRVRAVLRRVSAAGELAVDQALIPVGLSFTEHHVMFNGEEILTRGREHEVLSRLITAQGAIVTRDELLTQVWGKQWLGSPVVLSVTISRIRERLSEVGAPYKVENVRGIGFRLATRVVRERDQAQTGSAEALGTMTQQEPIC